MDRRVFLAVILAALVFIVTPILFPNSAPVSRVDSLRGDSSHATAGKAATLTGAKETQDSSHETQVPPAILTPVSPAASSGDSSSVATPHMTMWYSGMGGAPLRAELTSYTSRSPRSEGKPVVIATTKGTPLLQYRLLLGDTVLDLARAPLAVQQSSGADERTVEYQGSVGNHTVSLRYTGATTEAGRYLVHVSVDVSPVSGAGSLVLELPSTLVSAESDTADDIRHLAYGYKPKGGSVESLPFAKLDSGVVKQVAGADEWVAVRDKYFLVAVMTPDSSLGPLTFTGAPRVAKLAPEAMATATLPLRDGKAAFDLYVGPQEFERLRALGHDLDRVNPYAGWLHAVVQPFATLVTKVLLWMKSASGLGYGWVIIIFGVSIRLLLWPLNQSAMRTSIRMQRLQPELAEVQKRYKNDPDKQRDALVKLYQAHGMTPFSPMMGCLPMLLPMPILFALYFVFLNTIEFRGVSFLWLRDISAADPYYILPLLMGLSMFVLSWIGMRGMPPNPQTKMMSYMMPVVLTFMFFRFAAGLNLYYAVQNVAALPQQWLLARERAGIAKGDGATKDRRDKT